MPQMVFMVYIITYDENTEFLQVGSMNETFHVFITRIKDFNMVITVKRFNFVLKHANQAEPDLKFQCFHKHKMKMFMEQ